MFSLIKRNSNSPFSSRPNPPHSWTCLDHPPLQKKRNLFRTQHEPRPERTATHRSCRRTFDPACFEDTLSGASEDPWRSGWSCTRWRGRRTAVVGKKHKKKERFLRLHRQNGDWKRFGQCRWPLTSRFDTGRAAPPTPQKAPHPKHKAVVVLNSKHVLVNGWMTNRHTSICTLPYKSYRPHCQRFSVYSATEIP